MYSIRTDLANEMRQIAEEQGQRLEGVKCEDLNIQNVSINRIEILNETGSKTLNKPIGKYTTIDIGKASGSDKEFLNVIDVISHEIGLIIKLGEKDLVLIAGLGNSKITSDAFGPKVIDNIMVTRHLKENAPEFFDEERFREVAAITPGVLGQTGVETFEIIKSVVENIKPKLLIVLDALASRKMDKLATTVQITDTGISPGAGVGNKRSEISKSTMGIPVLAIGVPTVVDAATLASDVIDEVVKNSNGGSSFNELAGLDKYSLIRQSLDPFDLNLIVTPKDIDFIVASTAKTVGFSLNKALHRNITIEDMNTFIS